MPWRIVPLALATFPLFFGPVEADSEPVRLAKAWLQGEQAVRDEAMKRKRQANAGITRKDDGAVGYALDALTGPAPRLAARIAGSVGRELADDPVGRDDLAADIADALIFGGGGALTDARREPIQAVEASPYAPGFEDFEADTPRAAADDDTIDEDEEFAPPEEASPPPPQPSRVSFAPEPLTYEPPPPAPARASVLAQSGAQHRGKPKLLRAQTEPRTLAEKKRVKFPAINARAMAEKARADARKAKAEAKAKTKARKEAAHQLAKQLLQRMGDDNPTGATAGGANSRAARQQGFPRNQARRRADLTYS